MKIDSGELLAGPRFISVRWYFPARTTEVMRHVRQDQRKRFVPILRITKFDRVAAGRLVHAGNEFGDVEDGLHLGREIAIGWSKPDIACNRAGRSGEKTDDSRLKLCLCSDRPVEALLE